jgi:hypothetical protein
LPSDFAYARTAAPNCRACSGRTCLRVSIRKPSASSRASQYDQIVIIRSSVPWSAGLASEVSISFRLTQSARRNSAKSPPADPPYDPAPARV